MTFPRPKYVHSKLSKAILFISNLLVISALSDVMALRPDNDYVFILANVGEFIVAIVLSAAMMAYIRPKTMKILIWPLAGLALSLSIATCG
jgi:hypothetical protein